MTTRDDFDRHLAAWFEASAPSSEPEPLLGQVLARTARTRRRPAWRIPERWIPMSAITTRSARVGQVPWRTIGLIALLIVTLVAGVLVIAGTRRPALPPPFGVAGDGKVLYSFDGDIFVRDQAMIERVRLQEFAGIFQGGFLFRHLLVDARLYRFVPADLRFGLQRQQRAGAKDDHVRIAAGVFQCQLNRKAARA